ncbi:unnamed protein product [Mytilus edulis]|uniref:Uncharacterized protein n=1 Tax=Mytilus edulis TaxID=6550 RepID=A0A8S3RMC8_MYTED|nr:unnamed protein product [Mytilus edulis]
MVVAVTYALIKVVRLSVNVDKVLFLAVMEKHAQILMNVQRIQKCDHFCSNTVGSYRCSCRSGYQIAMDGLSCSDVNECLFVNGGCDDICVNTPGSFQCQCQKGQSLNANGRCLGGKNVTGGVQQTLFEVHKLARRLLPKGCAVLELASCGEQGISKYYFVFDIVLTKSYVFLFETTPRDVHALIASFIPTVFDKLYGILPNWVRFSKSGTNGLSITDLKTDLLTGEKVRAFSDCKGAPVYDGRLYSVFRFGTNMSITLFENNVHLPSPLAGNRFCLVVDICQDNGGTAFLLIPPESRNFLEKFDIFKSLHQNNGVIIRLLWGLFVDEWNALVQIKELGLTPAFTFKLFNQNVTLALNDIVTASIEAYLSIGGQKERTWCENGANPEGIFVSFMTNLNPLRDVPLVKDWVYDMNVRLHAFFTTSPNHIPTTNTTINILTDIEDLSAAIHRFGDVLIDLIQRFGKDLSDLVRKFLRDLQMLSVSFVQMLTNVIKTGKVDIKHISNIASNIWTTYIDSFKRKGQGVLDLLEFEKDVVAFNISRFIKEEQRLISHNVDKLLSKVSGQVLTAIKNYNGFGLRFSVDLYLIKLGFGQMDIEFIYSVDRLGQCSKFKKMYELLKGEESIKVLGRPTIQKRLGKMQSFGKYKSLGYFLKFELSDSVSLALSITSKKFVAHLHAHASVLGMKVAGDMLISNKGCL